MRRASGLSACAGGCAERQRKSRLAYFGFEATCFACRLHDHAAPPPPCVSLQTAAASSGKLLGAVVFERLPVIIPEDPDWELEYREWQQVSGALAGVPLPCTARDPEGRARAPLQQRHAGALRCFQAL